MKKWIQRTRYYPFNVVFVVGTFTVGAGFGDVTGTGVDAGVSTGASVVKIVRAGTVAVVAIGFAVGAIGFRL